MATSILPLAFMTVGRDAVVRDLAGGLGLRRRLVEMGIASGAQVRIIKNDMSGPLIVAVGEGRLAIGRGMASHILVEGTV